MVFNGDSGNLDLCTLADKMLGDSDDTEFPLSEKALYANMALRAIFREIYAVYGGWTPQDSNVSGIDSVATNLVSGTQFYAFATVAWLKGVEVEDQNGNVIPLIPITLEEIRERGYAEDEFMSQDGDPRYYRPVKNGIQLYPAPNYSLSEGLIAKIGAQDVSPFTAASTSTSPGYDSLAGHEAVAAGMAMFFADYNELSSFSKRKLAWDEAVSAVKSHYRRKFMEIKQQIKKNPMGGGFVDHMV